MIIATHILLAIILFMLQNWIGERAYARGYIRFSLLDDKDEALSLNYVLKVFGPIVYLILVVGLFEYLKLERFKSEIINVIYFYLGIRVIVIFAFERVSIVNWPRIIVHYLSILIASTIIYKNFINSVDTLLPDLAQIKNEIWLLVIIFLYQIGNGVGEKTPLNEMGETTTAYLPEIKSRKRKYILRKFRQFETEYGKTINEICHHDHSFRLVVLSLLIFENFNRPRILRFFERLWVRLTKRGTTQGIMQVLSDLPLSDLDSVKNGTQFLYLKYQEYLHSKNNYNIFTRTIKRHCPDRKYIRQILFIGKCIIDNSPSKEKYSAIFEEIKTEFQLYDYYD